MKKKPCDPSAKYHVRAAPAVALSECAPYCGAPAWPQRIVRSTTIGAPTVRTLVDIVVDSRPAMSSTRMVRRDRAGSVICWTTVPPPSLKNVTSAVTAACDGLARRRS